MSDNNEVDRWRRSLEEAESELQLANNQIADMQSFYCANITKLARVVAVDDEYSDEIQSVKSILAKSPQQNEIKQVVESLVRKIIANSPENPLNDDQPDVMHGSELYRLIERIEKSGPQLNDQLIQFKDKFSSIKSQNNLTIVIEEFADYWCELAVQNNKASPDPSFFCAMLISEILYQLIEKISLPQELSDRLAVLKSKMIKGVTIDKWPEMLTEITDMASWVQLKISHERNDIEVFLKQVTGRLNELDSYVQGSKEYIEKSHLHSQAFGDVVKQEIKNIVTSVDSERDIGELKKQIHSRLETLEKHLSGYNKITLKHHQSADTDVQKLLSRLSELEQESVKLKARVQKERMQAQMDALTGIANRLGYDNYIAQEYARWKRFGNPLALLVWDVDHFKRINDNYGHVAGDKALKTIANLLATKIRETDYLARFGGEEFVLVMPGANIQSAKVVANKLREIVEKSGFHFKGEPVSITISAGIAEFNKGDTPQAVFERADKALYEAKESGRNQVCLDGKL